MLSEKLKQLRNTKRIAQKEFAQAMGVSQQTVASWEVGRTEPSNAALKAIADYFNVTADYLLGREPPTEPKLSDEQSELLREYDDLNRDGRQDMWDYMKFLKYKYAPTEGRQYINGGDIKNNFVAFGGRNSVRQNVTMK